MMKRIFLSPIFPDIFHLNPTIQFFHSFIIELCFSFWSSLCPQHSFSNSPKTGTLKIRRGLSFVKDYIIKHLKAQVLKNNIYYPNAMISSSNPDSRAFFEDSLCFSNPCIVKFKLVV